jgi:hypothetical protein
MGEGRTTEGDGDETGGGARGFGCRHEQRGEFVLTVVSQS